MHEFFFSFIFNANICTQFSMILEMMSFFNEFSKTMFQKDMYNFPTEKVCTKDISNEFQTF